MNLSYEWLVLVGILALFALGYALYRLRAQGSGPALPPSYEEYTNEPPPASPSAPPFADLPDEAQAEISALLQQGQKIQAIKRYREQTGASLAEAKARIEAVEGQYRQGEPAPPSFVSPTPPESASAPHVYDLPDEVQAEIGALLGQGRKLQAIQRYREQTGAGLVEAKERIEAIEGPLWSAVASTATMPADLAELSDEAQAEIGALLQQGQKIQAIQRYRTHTGANLNLAKKRIEAVEDQYKSGER
jgi:ribosomal protein L7/L12